MGADIPGLETTDVAADPEGAAPLWSFITVTYNSSTVIRAHWNASLPEGVEWIVVDNASLDSSVEVARQLGARVVALPSNLGFSAANNEGARIARGSYVAFVNPDVIVDWSTLDDLAEVIEATEGVVAPQLLYPDLSPQPNGRGAPTLLRKVQNRLNGAGNKSDYLVIANESEARYVVWAIGAALALKRETFERIGGWDDSYFLYYEDKDFSLRAWRAGVPVIIFGGARWMHSWARATVRLRWKPWKYEIASAMRFFGREKRLLFSREPSERNRTAFELSGKPVPTSLFSKIRKAEEGTPEGETN